MITLETNKKVEALQALVTTRPHELANELIRHFGVTPPLAVMQYFFRNEGKIKKFWKKYMGPWKDLQMMMHLLRYEESHDKSICVQEWLKSLNAISPNEKTYLLEATKTGKLKRKDAELAQKFTSYDKAHKVWRKKQEDEQIIITPSRPPTQGKTQKPSNLQGKLISRIRKITRLDK